MPVVDNTKESSVAGLAGLAAVIIFCSALLIFGHLNQGFSFLHDFISKLGAKGEPYAIWWNITGFLIVGVILIGFGITYGKILKDRLAGVLLAGFGLGFAFTSTPIDLGDSDSPVSKAHTVFICILWP